MAAKNTMSDGDVLYTSLVPTISVVIPAYNEEKYLATCLKSVTENRTPAVVQILVVDNASSDCTADIARSFPGVTVVREEKKGLTCARQCGLKHATGDVLAWCDADCEVSRAWFTEIERTFDDRRSVVCLSGPYKYVDVSWFTSFIIACYWWVAAWPMAALTHSVAVGGNFAARKNALERIGGFDTSIAFYGEDTDIARRLRTVGDVRFSMTFRNRTSPRRFEQQGLLGLGWVYAKNFLSQAFFKTSATRDYVDVR
jgi:glycosyltransferase involved in cell wall biosynthesis